MTLVRRSGATEFRTMGEVFSTASNTKYSGIVLERGECYRLRHRGLAIVNALGGAAAVSFA